VSAASSPLSPGLSLCFAAQRRHADRGHRYELDAIAAVVVGGTSLFGGKGSVFGTFIGTLIIGILANILNLTGVDPFVQQLFKGALIVVAVYVMSRSNRT
jgi:ribose/xylose/arabinose/galactoside ABC-type transport system permease subunit